MTSFVLVHSPLVGPGTWRWVAEDLAKRGHRTMVAKVRGSVTSLGWEAFAYSVAAQLADAEHRSVVVGHSGAGPLLPQIRDRSGRPEDRLVFVDAGVPPEAVDAELMPSEFLGELRAMARDGMLPKWSEWFGPEVMEELIPDGTRRRVVADELPQLPLSYFEGRVPAPRGWAAERCGYLQLSEPYAGDAAEAARRKWPVLRLLGGHLDIVTRPSAVTDALLSLVDQLQERSSSFPG